MSARAEIARVAQFPDIHNWTEDFLMTLPVAELSYLDYKESRWLTLDEKWRQDVSKYLSAFANYEGGYLVIGVVDPLRVGAVRLDGGVPLDLNGGIVQWLENVLPDLVERPLDHLDVWAVTARSAQSALQPNHAVIVIHVRGSEGAPHQAREGKYYTRHGSRLKSLGHGAITDIAGRRKHPPVKVVNVTLTWTRTDDFILTAVVENTSDVSARFCSVIVDLPVFVGKEGFLSHNGAIWTTDDGLAAAALISTTLAEVPYFLEAGKLSRRNSKSACGRARKFKRSPMFATSFSQTKCHLPKACFPLIKCSFDTNEIKREGLIENGVQVVSVRIREFQSYDYKDPAAWLRALGEIEQLVLRSGLSYEVKSLRTKA